MKTYHQHTPIVITLPDIYPNEAQALFALTECGAGIIHLRKPEAEEGQIRELLSKLHPEILYHITLHRYPHLAGYFGLGGVHVKASEIGDLPGSFRKSVSCHNRTEVKAMMGHADYVFLSPIFDSVSKVGYKAAFSAEELREWLADPDRPVIVALGGISAENIARVKECGFEGAACLGSVWAIRDGRIDIRQTQENYRNILKAWNETKS